MITKSQQLLNGWTLIMHKSYRVFADKNSYIVVDHDNDVLMAFTLQEQEVEILKGSWCQSKINTAFKTIKILNDPDEMHGP